MLSGASQLSMFEVQAQEKKLIEWSREDGWREGSNHGRVGPAASTPEMGMG